MSSTLALIGNLPGASSRAKKTVPVIHAVNNWVAKKVITLQNEWADGADIMSYVGSALWYKEWQKRHFLWSLRSLPAPEKWLDNLRDFIFETRKLFWETMAHSFPPNVITDDRVAYFGSAIWSDTNAPSVGFPHLLLSWITQNALLGRENMRRNSQLLWLDASTGEPYVEDTQAYRDSMFGTWIKSDGEKRKELLNGWLGIDVGDDYVCPHLPGIRYHGSAWDSDYNVGFVWSLSENDNFTSRDFAQVLSLGFWKNTYARTLPSSRGHLCILPERGKK